MNINGFNIKIIIIALLAGLAILFVGQAAISQYNVVKPLDRFYGNQRQIQEFNIEKENGIYVITVSLKGVENLNTFYNYMLNNTESILGDHKFEIKIKNTTEDINLKDVFDKIQFPIYEGIQTGNYTAMEKRVQDTSANNGIFSKVDMDEQNIYIKLKHETDEMYVVISRIQNGEVHDNI